MSGKTYRIKALEWAGEIKEEFDSLRAGTPFGSYEVTMREGGSLYWGYCFDEYYDEDTTSCDSIEEGKSACEEHWRTRLERALVEVQEAGGVEGK